MPQLRQLNVAAHQALAAERGFPPEWRDMDELEQVTDAWFADWLAKRRELARERGGFDEGGPWCSLTVRFDGMV